MKHPPPRKFGLQARAQHPPCTQQARVGKGWLGWKEFTNGDNNRGGPGENMGGATSVPGRVKSDGVPMAAARWGIHNSASLHWGSLPAADTLS